MNGEDLLIRMVTNSDPWPVVLRQAVDRRILRGSFMALGPVWDRGSGWPVDARFYLTDSVAIAVLLQTWEDGGTASVERLLTVLGTNRRRRF